MTLTTGVSNTAVSWSVMFVATTGGANCIRMCCAWVTYH
jgi:hypothetical protein